MQNWNYSPKQSMNFTLAADTRLIKTEYTNDQIWQLVLGSSEPPALSLETTFGLRARLCRIFPRFIYKDQVINNPDQFAHPVVVHQYYPNYILLSFKPFSTINVKLEYWVPTSQAIACRTQITNTSHDVCMVELEWAELLIPENDGARMTVSEVGLTTILSGKTSDLCPVLFLSGGAQAGKSPYPSLNLPYTLPARGAQVMEWVHVSLSEIVASYEQAKQIINKNWDAEIAHIMRINSGQLEIFTGNKDWDNVFHLSQNIGYQLVIGPTHNCRAPSTVSTRNSDQGFSTLMDGSDYNYLWNGQTPLDVNYLSNFLLPSTPELFKGLLDNFLDTQNPQGDIDWKPGLGGQRSRLLAVPILADMTLRWFEHTGQVDYLTSAYPKLLAFFLAWFSEKHDRDGDQFPEWDQGAQTGFDDLPMFSQHHSWSMGVDISAVESPDLASYLFRESQALLSIANLISRNNEVEKLESMAAQLKSVCESAWSEQLACYLYRDRDTHLSPEGEILGSRRGVGVIDVHREFQTSVRPIIYIKTRRELTRPAQIFIHGNSAKGAHRVEHIPSTRIHWQVNTGFVTSDYCYSSIERIEINGLRPEDEVTAETVDFTYLDQSLLLPLWAGIPSSDRAKILINLTIMNKKKFLGPFGLRACIDFPGGKEIPEEFYGLHLPWTTLILEGLAHYGERKKAAVIFTRLMKPAIQALENDFAIYQSYHSETGRPLGTKNILTSLIPVGLFLRILGVKILSPTRVEISGHNPFPWPITIKYQGLTIVKHEKKSLVIFPNGQNITVDNEAGKMISCK